MIGKLIEETEYYSHIDRVLLPGKKRTQVDDLLIRTWIVKGAPKFQRTKYWICITLRAKELAGPPQATYQELALELPIGKDAVRKGCWRMNTGYTLPGVPRYHQHYVRRIPSGEYRLLKKGRRFIDRMDPIFTKNNKPYHDSRTLEKEVFNFLGYAPHSHQRIGAARIYIDDIDSFRKVKQIGSFSVTDIVPITLSETQIKAYFAEIIGEPFIPKDWGGETCDLFTNHIIYRGKRKAAGFVFKGPGLKSKSLKIKDLGKNGDQIVRLLYTTQDLYAVQYIDSIEQSVIEHLEAQVDREAHRRRKALFYCVINGTDTARLLKAYGKM